MGRAVFKLGDDQYLEWSSVVDAPVSYLHSRSEAVSLWGEDRIARADLRGHSYQDLEVCESPQELIACNRAGPGEKELTLDALLRRYKNRDSDLSFEFRPGDQIERNYLDEEGKWKEHPEPKVI